MRSSGNSLLPGWLSFMLSAAFILSAIAVMFFAFLTVQHMFGQGVEPEILLPVPTPETDVLQSVTGQPPEISVTQTAVAIAPTPVLAPAIDAWDGNERVNILLMGIDRRPGEAFVSRTDSIMVVSVDPVAKTAAVLSVPRDLYVNIPGYGQDRINTAYVYGSLGADYLSGAALAMQTVSYNLDIPIHHFMLLDFGAFIGTIDQLGGVDVNVPYTISDPQYPDMFGGYDPLFIPAGLQHFDGQTALKYARTRHADSDFNRAERQQHVLMAARQKALGLGITELIRRAPALYRELEKGIRTDLSLEQLVRLATTASMISTEDIRSGVLNQDFVTSYRTPQGASVLLLSKETALPYIQSLLAN